MRRTCHAADLQLHRALGGKVAHLAQHARIRAFRPQFVQQSLARFVLCPAIILLMTKDATPEIVESTAGQVAAELARRGIAPDRRVVVTIEPDDWIAEARRYSRPRVAAEGLTDDDIDRLIKQAQREVEPGPG